VSDNLNLYEAVRAVPPEAVKTIPAGRLKGKSDINPMWRIKTLTEQFGPCGKGLKITIDRRWLESAPNGEIAAFVEISLYIKHDGEWSDSIPGTGGSSFVANEKNAPYVSDECFKMALTDAISVACKMLGIGADVYWDKDKSKYDKPPTSPPVICPVCGNPAPSVLLKTGEVAEPGAFIEKYHMCVNCFKKQNAKENG